MQVLTRFWLENESCLHPGMPSTNRGNKSRQAIDRPLKNAFPLALHSIRRECFCITDGKREPLMWICAACFLWFVDTLHHFSQQCS